MKYIAEIYAAISIIAFGIMVYIANNVDIGYKTRNMFAIISIGLYLLAST